ncbi:hypothetical protein [Xenorhabdus bovienii]|uniref:hypothetical protein n=1 Tax=Xenorhabdus bovienii TaxID=40576 RepID=UPI0023B279D6|nr:hypothetical protein [Xenorhabdus bovienii]
MLLVLVYHRGHTWMNQHCQNQMILLFVMAVIVSPRLTYQIIVEKLPITNPDRYSQLENYRLN